MSLPIIPLIIASVVGLLVITAVVIAIVLLRSKMKKKDELGRIELEGPNPFMLEQPVKSQRSAAGVTYDSNGQAQNPSGPVFGHSLSEEMAEQ